MEDEKSRGFIVGKGGVFDGIKWFDGEGTGREALMEEQRWNRESAVGHRRWKRKSTHWLYLVTRSIISIVILPLFPSQTEARRIIYSPSQAVIQPSRMAKKHSTPIITGCPRLTVDSYIEQSSQRQGHRGWLVVVIEKGCEISWEKDIPSRAECVDSFDKCGE